MSDSRIEKIEKPISTKNLFLNSENLIILQILVQTKNQKTTFTSETILIEMELLPKEIYVQSNVNIRIKKKYKNIRKIT